MPYQGEKFKHWDFNAKGNNNMMSILQPQIIQGIYKAYLEEGSSNLIDTNMFLATTIAMVDWTTREHD
jgi:5-methyltetrahydrofolate--homocysteine methyltransferase